MPGITVDQAVSITRTGDLWLFRGSSGPDRAIRVLTNAPVNHVGVAVVIDDLPPMMWHAELGRSLIDLWTGTHHRGVQLHDLKAAVQRWSEVYHQRGWLRQLHPEAGTDQENAVLRTVARWNGTSFPTTTALAWRWLRGRAHGVRALSDRAQAEAAYCAEVAAVTLTEMGVLEAGRPSNWYDPGRFWSGDDLPLQPGWSYGTEIEVRD